MRTTGYTHVVCLLIGTGALALVTGCAASERAPAVASPSVSFAATASDVGQPCSIEGVPAIVAGHVMPMAGVTAQAEGSRVWLRFATRSDPRAALEIDPATLTVEDEDGTAPRELPVGAYAHDARRVPSGTAMFEIDGGRRLVAWTQGSAESGDRVQFVTLSDGGPVGVPVDLGFEGSAIGRPAIAVTAAGRGVLAFEESYGGGFHLVVSRVVCDRD